LPRNPPQLERYADADAVRGTSACCSFGNGASRTGGFADRDVTITAVDDTAYLIGRWAGADPKLKPLVISAHMDVVEAKPEDWQRDPFTPVVENGFLFGRGASDIAGVLGIGFCCVGRKERRWFALGYAPMGAHRISAIATRSPSPIL
jgi:hypothetical protein